MLKRVRQTFLRQKWTGLSEWRKLFIIIYIVHYVIYCMSPMLPITIVYTVVLIRDKLVLKFREMAKLGRLEDKTAKI